MRFLRSPLLYLPAVTIPEAPLTRRELAENLRCSTRQLDKIRSERDFPEYRVGDSPRFLLSEIVAWMKQRTTRATR